MKKLLIALLTLLLALALVGCKNKEIEEGIVEEFEEDDYFIEEGTLDKHIAYIENYIGKNCANIGYTTLGGDRNDYLGDAYIQLIYVTPDGTYLDVEDEEALKQYVVVAQSIEPDTEARLGFETDSEGNEYDNLVNFQSYEQIELQVKKVGEDVMFENELVIINPAIDKYTYYVPNFIGRNLLTCGYVSLGGDFRFKIGAANIQINIVTSDGSYVEMEEDSLKDYVVYDQSVKSNSEFKIQYKKDSDGNEYDNLVDQQSFKEIDLYVRKVNDTKTVETVQKQETKKEESKKEETSSSNGIRPEFKDALDTYEKFMDDYIAFMIKYKNSTDPLSMLTDYTKYVSDYANMVNKIEKLDDQEMSKEEAAYYLEVTLRVEQKLIQIAH